MPMRRATLCLAVLVAAAAAGCGGDENPVAAPSTAASAIPAWCAPMEPGRNDLFLLCRRPGPGQHGGFRLRGRGPIEIALPTDSPAGHWSGGFLSPDGRMLLLQWTAECEVPFALFVPARGGTPRFVTGEPTMEEARPSIAHGWTLGGEAIVELLPGCGQADPAAQTELVLVRPGGEPRRLR